MKRLTAKKWLTMSLLLAASLLAGTVSFANNGARPQSGIGPSFKGPIALQLWSLREDFKKNGVPATLAKVREMGFTQVELAGTWGLKPDEFRAELDKVGLKSVAMHVPFDRVRDKIDEVIPEAKLFGVEYVGIAWIPHKKDFTAEDCDNAAKVFNEAGKKLKAAGLKFMYHPHGYEFVPTTNGNTRFDDLVAKTEATVVDFELDIFWAYHGGADPVKLLQKYPKRFVLMHLKDMKKGTPRNLSGHSPDDTSVALGSGEIDIKGVLKAARKTRMKYYIVEEESPEPHRNIPGGLRFLEQLKY